METLSLFLSIKDAKLSKDWPFIKNVKWNDWVIATLSILILILSYLVGINNEKKLVSKQAQADRIQYIRDSLNKRREDSISNASGIKIDSATSKNINSFTTALFQYKLHYDSSQGRVLSSLNDSAHIKQSSPFVGFCKAEQGEVASVRLVKINNIDCVEYRICTLDAFAKT
jgi:hypothetical protein